MKKIFSLIIAFMALALPMTTLAANEKSSQTPIILSSHPDNSDPNPIIHRSPMRIPVEAWYDGFSHSISIIYYGEASGEVTLYKDGNKIDFSSVINTTFSICGSGYYTIEISTESWSAIGSIEI